jgi:hypothetical protein
MSVSSSVNQKTVLGAAILTALFLSGSSASANATVSDLTIEVAGGLLKHGGVVTVYPIKVSTEEWAVGMAPNAITTVRLDTRYTEIQLRYPANGTYTYRFRSVEAKAPAERHPTFVLSVIGTDEKDQGPQMKAGFRDAYSSGGRTIRVPPFAEIFGEDDATKTNARWGNIEGIDTPPPADERSARALGVIAGDYPQRALYACNGDANVQVCTIPVEQWPRLEALWWRAIAEQRLERLNHHALRRCYDSSWLGGGICDPVPSSDEPEYRKRK